MSQHIHCSVNTCHYWDKGNICKANEIVVVSDAAAADLPDRIDAPKAKTMQPTPTNTCMETCCKTFVQSDSAEITADGVKRMS